MSWPSASMWCARPSRRGARHSVPDADSLMALARARRKRRRTVGRERDGGKSPDDLAWETSLLDERVTSESQRLDRLVRSLKWALIGAAAMALAFGLFVWLPNQQFSYVIWWDSVADDPDYNKIVYRLNGEGEIIAASPGSRGSWARYRLRWGARHG